MEDPVHPCPPECRELLIRWAHRTISNKDDAQDLYQEICARCLAGESGFARRAAFETWLYRLKQNTLADYRRTRWRSLETPHQDVEAAAGSAPLSQVPSVLAEEVRESVWAALGKLTPLRQRLLVLRYLAGLSSHEIAAELGMEVRSVYQELYRAKAAFKRAYLDEEKTAG